MYASVSNSDAHGLTIRFSAVDGLSGLLDSCEHGLIRHGGFRVNDGGLGIEVDIERFHT